MVQLWLAAASRLVLVRASRTEASGPEASTTQASSSRPEQGESALAGLANVAAMTFLAARAVPGSFVVALAAGVPLARAAQRNGARAGYATAGASLIETMAVMGPARIGIPIPHAASAPALGLLERRGAALLTMALTGAGIRFGYYLVMFAFYIVVLVGVDAYTGTYDAIRQTLSFLPPGQAAAFAATAVFLAVWSLVAGLIQAWVIRRGLRRWTSVAAEPGERPAAPPDRGGRAEPRAVVGAGLVAIAVALITTEPLALGLVALWLAVAWLMVRAGVRSFLGGLALAAPLALSTFAFGLTGGLGAELAARRGLRVVLLVLTAVWLRSAAGVSGLRVVSRRVLHRLQHLPTLALAAAVLGTSAGIGSYGESARRLGRRVRSTRKRPGPLLEAALAWIVSEAGRLPPPTEGESRTTEWSGVASALVVSATGMAVLAVAAAAVPWDSYLR